MPQPHLRAADTDRAAVAAVLGQHMSAGRLTLEEYDERLTRAYAAKTFGELDQLTADLPSTGRPTTEPRAARRRDAGTGAGAGRPHRRGCLARDRPELVAQLAEHLADRHRDLGDDLAGLVAAALLLAGVGHRSLGRRAPGPDAHRPRRQRREATATRNLRPGRYRP